MARAPIATFRVWLNWFQEWDPKGQYNCFSQHLMAYYFSPKFMFDLAQLFTAKDKVFAHEWYIEFLLSLMRTQGRGIVSSPYAVLTPRYLCSSVVPGADDPPDVKNLVNRVYIVNPVTLADGTRLSPSKPLIHVWPDNPDDWRVLMASPIEAGGWGCNWDLKNDPMLWKDNPSWTDTKNENYTNFLYLYAGIPSDSLLVIGFATKQESWNKGVPLYPSVMHPLLGIKENSSLGGWYGLLTNGDTWANYDSLGVQSYVWGETLSPKVPAHASCSVVRSIGAGISGGVTGGMIAASLLNAGKEAAETAAGGPAGWAVAGASALGFLLFGGASATLDAASQGCMDNK